MVDRVACAARAVMPRAVKRIVPGDLRVPTVRFSYDPGYMICVIISDIEMPGGEGSVNRLPAIIADTRSGYSGPHDIRASAISSPDNIVLSGEEP